MHSILRGSVYNSVALRWNWFWANCSINKTPSINWLIKERLREVEVLFWLQRCTAVTLWVSQKCTHTFLHEVLFDWYICVHWGGWQLRRRASCRNVLPILKNTFSPLYGAKCYKDGGTLNFNLCWLIINVFRWKYISAPAKVIIMNRKSFHKFSNTFLSWTEWQSAFEPELRTGTEASIDSP